VGWFNHQLEMDDSWVVDLISKSLDPKPSWTRHFLLDSITDTQWIYLQDADGFVMIEMDWCNFLRVSHVVGQMSFYWKNENKKTL